MGLKTKLTQPSQWMQKVPVIKFNIKVLQNKSPEECSAGKNIPQRNKGCLLQTHREHHPKWRQF